MATLFTDTIEPRKSTQDITLGTSGETISVGANSINVNTVADKGGNTLWTSNGSGVLSSVSTGLKGAQTLISTSSITNGNSIEITSGLDSTYDLYIFRVNVSLTLAGPLLGPILKVAVFTLLDTSNVLVRRLKDSAAISIFPPDALSNFK